MKENRIKPTPLKFFLEILKLSPRKAMRVLMGNKLCLIDDSQVIHLLCNGLSLVRWADGETAIARNKSIGYQSSEPRLAKKLNDLLNNPDDSLIVGVPFAITEKLSRDKWSLKRLQILMSTRLYLSKIEKGSFIHLCDTFIWYRNYEKLQSIINIITKQRRVVLVASQEEYLRFVPTGTTFIKTSPIDSFLEYDLIVTQLHQIIESSKIPVTILCACGPTSKALVADFKAFAQVIDVGHGFSFANSGMKIYAWDI